MPPESMDTLPKLLLDRADKEPDRVAQRHKRHGIWQEYTFADVAERVELLALGLAERSVGRGQTVAIIGENEPETYWAEYAAQGIGAKTVSLYPDNSSDELAYILEESEAVVLFAQDQEQVDKAIEAGGRLQSVHTIIYWDARGLWSYDDPRLLPVWELAAEGGSAAEAAPARFREAVAAGSPDDVAVLSYTSGTTGRPKGVILTQHGLLTYASRFLAALPLRPGHQYLSYISPAWSTEQIFGLTFGLLVPLVINFPEGPEQVQENLRELAVQALMFSPRQWENLAATMQARMLDAGPIRRRAYDAAIAIGQRVNVARLEGRRPSLAARLAFPLADKTVLAHLRDKLGLIRADVALSGGTAMAPDIFRLFVALGVPLRNIYGATEVGILTMHQRAVYDVETAGQWLYHDPAACSPMHWRIRDGELQVRDAGFQGYYRRPDATEERWDGEWFKMGDAVTQTEEGELVFLDRLADMQRLGTGHDYPPQFIEVRLRFSPFIKEVLTLGDETRPFVAALVNIDFEVASRWAEERRIGFANFTDLSQKTEILTLIRDEIRRMNRLLPEASRVKRFANFPKDLDPDDDEVTRTRKLRRTTLRERYGVLIAAIYDGVDRIRVRVPVRYRDGRTGQLDGDVAVVDVDEAAPAGKRASVAA